jgi:hypothetical protein
VQNIAQIRKLAKELVSLLGEDTVVSETKSNVIKMPKIGRLPKNFRKPNGIHLSEEGREWLLSKLRDYPDISNKEWIALTGLTNIIINKHRDMAA